MESCIYGDRPSHELKEFFSRRVNKVNSESLPM